MAFDAPPGSGSPSMAQKIFLPGSTYRQTFWDPRTAQARVVGWATDISVDDPSPRRSIVDKYFATYGYFFPEQADDLMILDTIDVEMKGPTKAKFAANYKIQEFTAGGGGQSTAFQTASLRPSTIAVPTYRAVDPDASPFLDTDGLPQGAIYSDDVCKQRPIMHPMIRPVMEMTVTVYLGQNPLVFLGAIQNFVNSDNVIIVGVEFAPHSIMYIGHSMEVFQNRFGTTFVVTYTFTLDAFRHKQQVLVQVDPGACTAPAKEWTVETGTMGAGQLPFRFYFPSN